MSDNTVDPCEGVFDAYMSIMVECKALEGEVEEALGDLLLLGAAATAGCSGGPIACGVGLAIYAEALDDYYDLVGAYDACVAASGGAADALNECLESHKELIEAAGDDSVEEVDEPDLEEFDEDLDDPDDLIDFDGEDIF